MKKIFLLYSFVISISIFSQQKFDCNNISRQLLLSKYSEIKHLGINYKFKEGTEVIPVLLTKIFDENSVRQICIDAAYDNHIHGTEKQYKLYSLAIKNISKEQFFQNHDFLMMYLKMITQLEETTNYRRMR